MFYRIDQTFDLIETFYLSQKEGALGYDYSIFVLVFIMMSFFFDFLFLSSVRDFVHLESVRIKLS